MKLEGALNLVRERIHDGYLALLSEDVPCFRRVQQVTPIDLIAVDSPIALIGLVDKGSLNNSLLELLGSPSVAFERSIAAILRDNGESCSVLGLGHLDLNTGIALTEAIIDLIKSELGGFKAQGGVTRILKLDDAIGLISERLRSGGYVLFASEDVGCLRAIQAIVPMEFIIVEKPIFLTGLVKRGDAPGRLRRMLKASREVWNGAVLIAVRGLGKYSCGAEGITTRSPGEFKDAVDDTIESLRYFLTYDLMH